MCAGSRTTGRKWVEASSERSTATGPSAGPGCSRSSSEGAGRPFQYVVTFACPSPTIERPGSITYQDQFNQLGPIRADRLAPRRAPLTRSGRNRRAPSAAQRILPRWFQQRRDRNTMARSLAIVVPSVNRPAHQAHEAHHGERCRALTACSCRWPLFAARPRARLSAVRALGESPASRLRLTMRLRTGLALPP
jgi:hypothetical protein